MKIEDFVFLTLMMVLTFSYGSFGFTLTKLNDYLKTRLKAMVLQGKRLLCRFVARENLQDHHLYFVYL